LFAVKDNFENICWVRRNFSRLVILITDRTLLLLAYLRPRFGPENWSDINNRV